MYTADEIIKIIKANQDSIACTCFNPNVGLVVSGSSGDISAVSISTGSKTINASGMWHY